MSNIVRRDVISRTTSEYPESEQSAASKGWKCCYFSSSDPNDPLFVATPLAKEGQEGRQGSGGWFGMSRGPSSVKGWLQKRKGSSEKGLQSHSERKVAIFACVTALQEGFVGFSGSMMPARWSQCRS